MITKLQRLLWAYLDRMAKIIGLIPDKSLVTVDQRSLKFDQPVTFRIDELAKLVVEDDNRY